LIKAASKISKSEIRKMIKKIRLSKRAKIVVESILKRGHVTTEELMEMGYEHPPRAIRDVREAGIPLETFRIKSPKTGRMIAAYRFGDLTQFRDKLGRKIIPKQIKDKLYKKCEGRCAICSGIFKYQYMQVDHRIPYEIAGDATRSKRNIEHYMLLCASCNRAKSWSCEHCPNWLKKLPEICSNCYWANPEKYTHIALREVRRMDILWDEKDLQIYKRLKSLAQINNCLLQEYVKKVLKEHVEEVT